MADRVARSLALSSLLISSGVALFVLLRLDDGSRDEHSESPSTTPSRRDVEAGSPAAVVTESRDEKRLQRVEEDFKAFEQRSENLLRDVDERISSLERTQRLGELTLAFSVSEDNLQLVPDFRDVESWWCQSFPLPDAVDEVVEARYWQADGDGEWKLLSPLFWKLVDSRFIYGACSGFVSEDRLYLYRTRLRITVRRR